jgi:hypothetical protein
VIQVLRSDLEAWTAKQAYGEAEWKRIEPLLPRGRKAAHRVDDRRVISGIMHMLRSGARWRDCPDIYGPYTTARRPVLTSPQHDIAPAGAGPRAYPGGELRSQGGLERDEPMTTFLPTSIQCTLTMAAFACKVRAWCVTKTLTKLSREMAVIAKTGGIRNLPERPTCAQGGLPL